MNYSQNNEQEAILGALEGIENGKFLEIGAWDAKHFSNTRALYERGWSGVMVEPSPAPMLNLLKEYGNDPRITLVQAAVGIERGLRKFHLTADAVSTDSPNHYERWKGVGGYLGVAMVPGLTIADLVAQFGEPHFISIDVEGNSARLFAALMNEYTKAKCICVEHDNEQAFLRALAANRGYRQILENGENLVFAK